MAPQHRPSAAAPRRPRCARPGPWLAALVGVALLAVPTRAQTADGSPLFTTQPQMRIPFTPSAGGQVKLVASESFDKHTRSEPRRGSHEVIAN